LKQHHSSGEHELILDSGDFIGGRGKKEQLKAEFLLQGFSQLRYDAINLGERDFFQGLKFLKKMQQKHQVPFVSANVFQPDGTTPVFPPYIIKQLKKIRHGDTTIPSVRVGIFGVMMVRSQLTFEKDDPKLVVGDPIETAKKMVSKLKNQCDIIIGLIHLPYSQLPGFIKAVPGIDVVIAGHDPVMRLQPQKIENTIVIAGGNRGQYIGDLRLVLNREKKIIDYEGNVVKLDAKIQDDPAMLKLIRDYRDQETSLTNEINRERYRSIKMYVGATRCQKCHQEQYNQWKKTPHARKQNDFHCTQCHTTGFAQYNGFYNYKETPGMINVQCEACHGIGKLHVQSVERIKSGKLQAAILAPISEQTCTGCHTKTRDPKFNYAQDLKKVRH